MNEDADSGRFCVVMNMEEQYSVWPAQRQLPDGWRDGGFQGTKEECLAHVDRTWADMRPLSLKRRMSGVSLPE